MLSAVVESSEKDPKPSVVPPEQGFTTRCGTSTTIYRGIADFNTNDALKLCNSFLRSDEHRNQTWSLEGSEQALGPRPVPDAAASTPVAAGKPELKSYKNRAQG